MPFLLGSSYSLRHISIGRLNGGELPSRAASSSARSLAAIKHFQLNEAGVSVAGLDWNEWLF